MPDSYNYSPKYNLVFKSGPSFQIGGNINSSSVINKTGTNCSVGPGSYRAKSDKYSLPKWTLPKSVRAGLSKKNIMKNDDFYYYK